MTRSMWQELGPENKWAPSGYWDDWMRQEAQRKGRQILRPEVSCVRCRAHAVLVITVVVVVVVVVVAAAVVVVLSSLC